MSKTPINLFTGFLGAGKTTALLHLLAHKPADEVWAVIVNEFGEIGIDGAVLSGGGAEVREIAGGCLCCATGPQLPVTLVKLIREKRPHRVLIEASGLAHASNVVDELRRPPLGEALDIQASITVVDPRQFIDANYRRHPIYRDQIELADVLAASKADLADAATLAAFQEQAQALFPPKARIEVMQHGQLDPAWLSLPARPAARYRPKLAPADSGMSSAGWTFASEVVFDLERVGALLRTLPQRVPGLARAKAVLRMGPHDWLWFNWVAGGEWAATQVAWRRDSRFELIAPPGDWAAENEAELGRAIAAVA